MSGGPRELIEGEGDPGSFLAARSRREEAMAEPMIVCPKCGAEIKLTESLAAPLVEATRLEYQQLLQKKEDEISRRESDVRTREDELLRGKEGLEGLVSEKLQQERPKIAAEEEKRIRRLLETDLTDKDLEIATLTDALKERGEKLAKAQTEQLELQREKLKLDEDKSAMELTIAKRVQDEIASVREGAFKRGEEQAALKMTEKDTLIESLQRTIAELNRKVDQGSQQLQGEAQEIVLERLLAESFPSDSIEPVKKGEPGADVLQRVTGLNGQASGTILWESKRTKNWSSDWLAKLRQDQREAGADVAVLVSQVLPKGVEVFDLVDGVLVVGSRATVPVASMVRQSLIGIASARQASEGQQTKKELIYQYLTGTQFRQRVEAILEALSSLQANLTAEKKAITKLWTQRQKQLENAALATAGMYGDLQGVAGKSIQEIEGLCFPSLSEGDRVSEGT